MSKPEPERCVHCGKTEVQYGYDEMRLCAECDEPCCHDCGNWDVDCVGDPPRYVETPLVCDECPWWAGGGWPDNWKEYNEL